METYKIKRRLRTWRWAAIGAFLLLIATVWIVFDGLFAPFGEQALTVEIPDFCGEHVDNLTLADWMELRVEYRYDATQAAGVILAQSPVGSSRRKLTAQSPKCQLTLTVSLGEETLVVPDVIGKDRRQAEAYLREQGLAVQVEAVTGAYPEGMVFAMEPRADTEVPIGSTVKILVSAGVPSQTVTVPNVCGLSRSDALIQLWLAQLTVGEVIEERSEAEVGTVIRQSHLGGTLVSAGTRITLYVSSAWDE